MGDGSHAEADSDRERLISGGGKRHQWALSASVFRENV
jgi:hypothetical protein